MGPQCWGGTCSLGRARAVSVVGEQAQRAEGRGQRTTSAQAVRLGIKHLYQLSHLTKPSSLTFKHLKHKNMLQ